MTGTADKAFERLKRAGAVLMPPATESRVAVASDDLTSGGYAGIPADYAHFLTRANGAKCVAFVLFGTEPQGASEPDIYEATEGVEDKQALVLGRAGGGLGITYAAGARKYQIVDKSCGDVLFEYAGIGDLVMDWLDRKKL